MIPPEFQLLLDCARSQPAARSINQLVDAGVIDWPKVLELAEQHRVRPLLLRSLKAVRWDAVPPSTQFELERIYRSNARRNLLLAGELLRLLGEFQKKDIPVAAIKGPVLAEAVYGDLSLREFCDLDVLVHEENVSQAEDVLVACGYQAQFADRDYRAAFLSYQGQYAFRLGQTDLWVDLHWQLSREGVVFPLKSAEVWPRLEQATIAGRTVPTLAHDDLALFLAAHGTKEGWRSLMWLSDFAELLRKDQKLDWIALLDRAERSHSSRQLLLAIILASAMLDAPAPAELINKARASSAVMALAEGARTRMLRVSPKGSWEFRYGLNTHDKWRHRLWPITALLTTRTVGDYQAMPLPKSLWGLYYLTHPFRAAGQLAKAILRTR
jgi:Uncharacterised nucleotidyltransferase